MTYTIDLAGKVAVVTGGSGVLGSAMCQALAQAGAVAVVIGTSIEKAQSTVDTIVEQGGKALPLAADVLDKNILQDACDTIMTEFGRIDILINCAGGNKPEATTAPDNSRSFFDLPEDALQWVFNLNFMGTLLPSQVFARQMAEKGEGVIINISSMAADRPMTRVVGYAAAKAGIDNFTKWLAVYMAKEYSPNIRVNAISPGFFITTQNLRLVTNEDGSYTDRGQLIVNNTPMARFGQPDELVGALMWLVSDGAKFVTGTIVPVDGGFSAFSGV
ncbi:MAG: D-mannonate oxidoreductase [Anaerolineaceae bacterium]|nr:D-mannonate oxidoreductase [Anaerolineaceae bacterium]